MPRVRKQISPYEIKDYRCRCGCGKRIEGWKVYFNAACRKRWQRMQDRYDRERDAALENNTLASFLRRT